MKYYLRNFDKLRLGLLSFDIYVFHNPEFWYDKNFSIAKNLHPGDALPIFFSHGAYRSNCWLCIAMYVVIITHIITTVTKYFLCDWDIFGGLMTLVLQDIVIIFRYFVCCDECCDFCALLAREKQKLKFDTQNQMTSDKHLVNVHVYISACALLHT